MSNKKQRLYWDACVFLSYINGTPGRVDTIDELLAKSKSGSIQIITSTISMVEVSFSTMEKGGKALDPQIEKQIDDLWNDRDAIALAEVTELVNLKARELIRTAVINGWKLKPMDAIHLASAVQYEADELHTYNLSDFKKFEPIVGFKIDNPYLVQGILGLPKSE